MPINKERLISLAVWAAGEDAKLRLGLPSEWAQDVWLEEANCGTVCCIAGKVALEDGGKPVRKATGSLAMCVTFQRSGVDVDIEEHAQAALGLDWSEADRLFSPFNELDDVLRIIGELIKD